MQVTRYIEGLNIVNSYDTWHGEYCMRYHKSQLSCASFISISTKNVAKELRKICHGAVRGRDVTWFTQLSDKGVYINVLTASCCYSTLVYY